jgi:phage terminase small subunit
MEEKQPSEKQLTDKQKAFCDEYLIDLNATQAAIRAGYSKKSARQKAWNLLDMPEVQAYIKARMDQKNAERIATQDEILEYLTSVMRGKSQSEVVVVEGIGDGCSEARTMEKAPDEKERLKAAELLGKRHGLYTEKIEQAVDMDLNITIDYGEGEEE